MRLRRNKTPWVDRNVEAFKGALLDEVPNAAWMPKETGDGFEELGCGHYGCVMPTEMPDKVLKVTTDYSEAAFARAAMFLADPPPGMGSNWSKSGWPIGMIRYYAIYQLEGTTHYNRPIFAIWRDEATRPGFVVDMASGYDAQQLSTYDRQIALQGLHLLKNTKEATNNLWYYLVQTSKSGYSDRLAKVLERRSWGYERASEMGDRLERSPFGERSSGIRRAMDLLRGADKAALALGIYENAAMMLRHNNPLLYTVGEAMENYLEESIVFGDLHPGNVAMATHPDFDGEMPVIMDPGRAIFLSDDYDSLAIESLERTP